MDGRRLHESAEARAEQMPGAVLTHPFGPEAEVYKVQGKIFMLLLDVRDEPIVNLKVTPEDGLALRTGYDEIKPAWHMNKRHWISVHPGDGIDQALLEELVTESYLLVVEKLPRAKRPVNPGTFGRG